MKLSSRERLLMFALALLLLAVLLFKFVLIPTGDKVLRLEDELSLKQSDALEYRTQIAATPQYETDIAAVERRIALLSSRFKKPMANEEIDSLIQGFMQRYEITGAVEEVGGLVMTTTDTLEMYEYGVMPPEDGEIDGASHAAILYGSTVTVGGTGSFQNIAAFADAFSKESAIRMTSLEIDYIYHRFTATLEIYTYA